MRGRDALLAVTDTLHAAATAHLLDAEGLRARVQTALADLLGSQLDALGFLGEDLAPVAEALRGLVLEGGKRMRPALVWWGYRGAGGHPAGPLADAAVRASCSVELLHVCARIHGDVLGNSRMRRGRPTVHVQFADRHRAAAWRGDPSRFGEGAAIVMGDLAAPWADVALADAGLPDGRLPAALRVLNRLRAELIGGRYLDLVQARRGGPGEAAARRVLTSKSGIHNIERPLHMGLAVADGPGSLEGAYSGYGLPLGEAFQLRDEVLAVFGAPEVTGKPAGDYLREGKETWLVLRARALGGRSGRRLLEQVLGDPQLTEDQMDAVRRLIGASGALADTETRIAELVGEAKAAIAAADVDPCARAALVALADHATHWSR